MRKQEQKPVHTEHDDLMHMVARGKEFLRRNWLHLVLFVSLVALGVAGLRYRELSRSNQSQATWEMLSSLPDPMELRYAGNAGAELARQEGIAQCRAIIQRAPGSPEAQWALARLAGLLDQPRDHKEALATYEQLLGQHRDTAAARVARPAYADTLEEAGRYEQAAGVYEELAAAGQAPYLFDAGRCRELAGQGDAAAGDYRAFLDKAPGDDRADLARTRLADVAAGRLLPPVPPLPEPVAEPAQPAEGEPTGGPAPAPEETAPASAPLADE